MSKNRQTTIFISLLILAFSARGQIITDSKKKLKTKKSEYSWSPFRSGKIEKSKGMPVEDNKKIKMSVSSRKSPFKGFKFRPPSYTSPSLKRSGAYYPKPRYSPSNPFKGMSFKIKPLYSGSMPFRGSDYKISPRYSPSNPFKGMSFKVKPRYSGSMPFRGNDYKVTPRYSPSRPFAGMKFYVNPRYSPPKPFANYDIEVRYTNLSFKEKFYVSKRLKDKNRPVNPTSSYTGGYKYKFKKVGDAYPTWRHKRAMKYENSFVRNVMRKWDKYLAKSEVRENLSKKGRKKVKKAKFDRKERTIWNN